MPGFDGTGPRGLGPMTGGGRGFCAVPVRPAWPGYPEVGYGMPYAGPWGVPYQGAPPFSPETARQAEFDYLKGVAQSLRDDLTDIEARIQEIESQKD